MATEPTNPPAVSSFTGYPTRLDTPDPVDYQAAVAAADAEVVPFKNEINASVQNAYDNSVITFNNAVESDNNAAAAAQSASDASGSATEATEQADRSEEHADIAVAAVAALPEGTINDTVIASDKAWSSEKINNELSAGSQLGSFQLPVSIGDLFTVPFSRTETSAAVTAVYREEASLSNSSNTFLVQSGQSGFTYDDTKAEIYSNSLRVKPTSSEGYGLEDAYYDSVSFSVAGQGANPFGLAFNNDGSKMYVVGNASGSVYQYTLLTPFDLSAVSYDSVSFSVSGQDASPLDLAFNNDGSKMYVLGGSSDSVYQYTLLTPFDLSAVSYDSVSFSVSGQDASPLDLAFNNDGSKMYVVGVSSDSVYQYTLSTPFDLSTASYDSVSFSVSGQDVNPRGLAFNNDGSKMCVVGGSSDSVYQYTLLTPFDLSTASYDSVSFSIAGQETGPNGLAFNNDGSKMYVVGVSSDSVHQYTTLSFTYPTGEYIPAVTTNPLDTSYWIDIAGITPSDTLPSGSVNYALSNDGKDTWCIFKAGESPRSIVRNNAGTWEYNSNLTFGSETWTAASVNTMNSALSESMTVEANKMSSAFGDSYLPLTDTLDQAVILYTDSTSKTPTYENTSISYDSFAEYKLLTPKVDYEVAISDNAATIESKVSGNIKGRVL